MLYLSVSMILFVTALYMGFTLFSNVSSALDQTYEANQERDRNQSSTLKETSQTDTVLGAVVLQTIYHKGDVQVRIVVDGVGFEVNDDLDDEAVRLKLQRIYPRTVYQPTYIRNSSGTLTSILYTSQ